MKLQITQHMQYEWNARQLAHQIPAIRPATELKLLHDLVEIDVNLHTLLALKADCEAMLVPGGFEDVRGSRSPYPALLRQIREHISEATSAQHKLTPSEREMLMQVRTGY